MSDYPDRGELFRKAVQAFTAYQDAVTWFGRNSVAGALLRAVAFIGEIGVQLAVRVLARTSPLSATGEDLDVLLAENGTERRGATRAQVLVILRPAKATVTAITIGGGSGSNDLIEVDDSSNFAAAMSIRIRNVDATITETKTIIAITTGTGPNGGDELEVTALAGTYDPAGEDTVILARVTVPAGTALSATSGVSYSTLEQVTTGEANPLLNGESTAVSLADKVLAEADETGAAGNIDPGDITNLATPLDGLLEAFNPSPGVGGTEEETDAEARVRVIGQAAVANQLTDAWLAATARAGNEDVLRTVLTSTSAINGLTVAVLTRSGGALGTDAKTALSEYIEARQRAGVSIEIADVTMTEVSITATVTLARGAVLHDVWVAAASAVATYLDYTTWAFGADVDAGTLYDLVRNTSGVASIDPGDFTPAADVTVNSTSLPYLVYLALTDSTTGDIVGGDLTQEY